MRLVSYAGVAAVGGWLLWRAGRADRAPGGRGAASGGALPYFAGPSPCPLTTIVMVVALAQGALVGLLLLAAELA